MKLEAGHADNHIKEHLQALTKFAKETSPLTWEKQDEIDQRRCYKITFSDLWLLYPPGATVFDRGDGAWRAYKVDRVETYTESHPGKMLIYCWFLDFDKTGQWLVPHVKVFHVNSYSSERLIENLEVLPSWYCPSIENKLIERGQSYWSYGRKVSYKQYDGYAWPRTSQEVIMVSNRRYVFYTLC